LSFGLASWFSLSTKKSEASRNRRKPGHNVDENDAISGISGKMERQDDDMEEINISESVDTFADDSGRGGLILILAEYYHQIGLHHGSRDLQGSRKHHLSRIIVKNEVNGKERLAVVNVEIRIFYFPGLPDNADLLHAAAKPPYEN